MDNIIRKHKLAVGLSLKGKVDEFRYLLLEIIKLAKIISKKHVDKNYPITDDAAKLNYMFSAFLNVIQSIKDATKTSTSMDFTWKQISPSYGDFIFYCRNATTHDGTHMINASKDTCSYIVGPLSRIDGNGKVKTIEPPKEDILTLSYKIADEVLSSLKDHIVKHGSNIPTSDERDCKESIETAINHDFVPDFVKEMMKSNKEEILLSVIEHKNNSLSKLFESIECTQNVLLTDI